MRLRTRPVSLPPGRDAPAWILRMRLHSSPAWPRSPKTRRPAPAWRRVSRPRMRPGRSLHLGGFGLREWRCGRFFDARFRRCCNHRRLVRPRLGRCGRLARGLGGCRRRGLRVLGLVPAAAEEPGEQAGRALLGVGLSGRRISVAPSPARWRVAPRACAASAARCRCPYGRTVIPTSGRSPRRRAVPAGRPRAAVPEVRRGCRSRWPCPACAG